MFLLSFDEAGDIASVRGISFLEMAGFQHHFTNKNGFNGIRAAKEWHFVASKPPCEHPRAVYFTSLDEATPRLAQRLRIPRDKLKYVFAFQDRGDLVPLDGGRGQYVFYSTADYFVEEELQVRQGETGL